MGFQIESTGVYLPRRIVTNQELERKFVYLDRSIEEKVGIKTRRFSSENESCCNMGLEAAIQALSQSRISLNDIGLIIFGTNTPGEEYYPFHQEFALNLSERLKSDFSGELIFLPGVCTLPLQELKYAERYFLEEGSKDYALCVAATDQSKYIDLSDTKTAIIFGDAAHAILLKKSHKTDNRFLELNDSSGFKAMYYDKDRKMRMPSGREIYQFVFGHISPFFHELKGSDEIDWYILHQAQGKMIQGIVERTGIPEEKMINNYRIYGNTGCCSIGVGLHEAIQDGRIKRGDKIMLLGFAVGYHMMGCVLEY